MSGSTTATTAMTPTTAMTATTTRSPLVKALAPQDAALSDRLGWALALANRGFAVFPLRPGGKQPAVREDWGTAAVRDPVRLRALGWPDGGNIGVACGPSALFVLDLDVPKPSKDRAGPAPHGEQLPAGRTSDGQAEPEQAPDGASALRTLAAGRPIPRTFIVSTPSGGTHLYFRAPAGVRLRNTVARLGPMIDTRAAGGYVVGPGSQIDGRPYEIVDDAPIAPVPRWLVRELIQRTRAAQPPPVPPPNAHPGVPGERMPNAAAAAYGAAALHNEVERMLAARVGTRNDTLNRAAYALGRLVGAGLLDRELASAELFEAARRLGLPARECSSTLASGLNAGMARPRFPARRRPGDRPGGAISVRAEASPPRETPFHAVDATAQPAQGAPIRDQLDIEGFDALKHLDEAYDAVAVRAAALVFSADWRRIRALMDTLRDLRDLCDLGDARRFTAGRRYQAALLCTAVSDSAGAILRDVQGSVRRSTGRGRSRSPLAAALRKLKSAADAAHAVLADESDAGLRRTA